MIEAIVLKDGRKVYANSHCPPSPNPPSESLWVDGLIMKRVKGGGEEAHENCMGAPLP